MKAWIHILCLAFSMTVIGSAEAQCSRANVTSLAPADTHYIINARVGALPSRLERSSLEGLLQNQLDSLDLPASRRRELSPWIEAVTVIRVRREPPGQDAQLVLLELSQAVPTALVQLLARSELVREHREGRCHGLLYSRDSSLRQDPDTPVPPWIQLQVGLLPPSPHWAVSKVEPRDYPSLSTVDLEDLERLESVGAAVHFDDNQASVIMYVVCDDNNNARSVRTALLLLEARAVLLDGRPNIVRATRDSIPADDVSKFLNFFRGGR